MIRLNRFYAIAQKEFIHIVRDWRSLFLALAIPMVLILLFGYALTLDLKNVPTIVLDRSGSPQSRRLVSLFDGSPYFSLTRFCSDYRELESSLNRGRAMLALVIPDDFSQKILANKPVKLQVLVDGSDANSARLALGYVKSLAMIYSEKILAERVRLTGPGDVSRPLRLDSRAMYNPDLRSQNTIIPGILAVVMVVIAAMLTSVTVAREWEMGSMEQLISTPVRVPELVLGKVVPYFIIGMTDVAIAVFMGRWLFEVPLRGNAGLLFAVAAIFLIGALFLGMLLSIVLKTQVLANQMAILISYMPTLLLSGFVFAIENMPHPIQILTYIVPARYFIALLRGIYLKGIGLETLWINALLLTLYALIMVILANRKMRLYLE
jgi:drug efflux transport system permease protein